MGFLLHVRPSLSVRGRLDPYPHNAENNRDRVLKDKHRPMTLVWTSNSLDLVKRFLQISHRRIHQDSYYTWHSHDPFLSPLSPLHKSTPTVKFLYKRAVEKAFLNVISNPEALRENSNTLDFIENCLAKKKKAHKQTKVKNYKRGKVLTTEVKRFIIYLLTEIMKQRQNTTGKGARAVNTNSYFTEKNFLKHIKEYKT